MPTITLDEMSAIKLMNRVDTKYVMSEEKCMQLLERAVGDYSVQIIDDVRACRYSTLYYDTPEWEMYTVHHNRRLQRQRFVPAPMSRPTSPSSRSRTRPIRAARRRNA